MPKTTRSKSPRLYAIFAKWNRKWNRITKGGHRKEAAERLYRDLLLAGFANNIPTKARPVESEYEPDSSPAMEETSENWHRFKQLIHATLNQPTAN